MKTLTYNQTTPSASWSIAHNFGSKPTADVFVTNVDGSQSKILPMRITNVDDNTLLIEFSSARAGSVRLAGSMTT